MFRRLTARQAALAGLWNPRVRFVSVLSRAIDLSDEVRSALTNRQPVVALESTIITHGMPHPQNVETANQVEAIVRDSGAVPATVAIVRGRVKVGLSPDELDLLARPDAKCVKTSRRDFPFVLAKGLNGGTTVSGTLMIAGLVGIKLFVTGGIGGVHVNGENTMDVSADLVEMGRQPVMVVSSGVKSILDIGKTLEFLETQGVCVMSYGPSRDFPAFYTRKSGFAAQYNVTSAEEAAETLLESHKLGISSGILLAVPIPQESSLDDNLIRGSIAEALTDAEAAGVRGKEVTPFLLERLNRITAGKSLESNIALIKNNARVGAQVAVKYQELNNRLREVETVKRRLKHSREKITVIGGSNLDCVMTLQTELKTDGRSLPGIISQTPGGVGRNMADSLGKLREGQVSFISALADDQFGKFLFNSIRHLETSGVKVVERGRTATYCALVDRIGDTVIGVGDMEIHKEVTSSLIKESSLAQSSFVVLDGNIPEDTIEAVLEMCQEKVPVWYEPTDVLKAPKPFKSGLWTTIACTSPNMSELKEMAHAAGVRFDEEFSLNDVDTLLKQLTFLAKPLVEHIPVVMVTMGKLGLLMVTRCQAAESLQKTLGHNSGKIAARYYPSVPVVDVTNSLGAGDNAAAGFIDGLLRGCLEPECVALGLLASKEALQSQMAVPEEFKGYDHQALSMAAYHELPITVS